MLESRKLGRKHASWAPSLETLIQYKTVQESALWSKSSFQNWT